MRATAAAVGAEGTWRERGRPHRGPPPPPPWRTGPPEGPRGPTALGRGKGQDLLKELATGVPRARPGGTDSSKQQQDLLKELVLHVAGARPGDPDSHK